MFPIDKKCQHYFSCRIYGLIVTGPKGISKSKISTEEYVIKWKPTENEVNDHFPICFISEARDRWVLHESFG